MLATQLKILRVYGLPSDEVSAVLRAARDEGCPGLRLLERDGEFAVCVQVSAPTQSMAAEHCDKWIQRLRAKFGDAVYGVGEISLAQAALNALLQKRRLLVSADETTGRLLGAPLRPLPHAEAVFDFGNETWADPDKARQIAGQPGWLRKFPGDEVQAAAARAQNALQLGGGDYAAVYMPAAIDCPPFVLVCDRRSAWACALRPDQSDAAIANAMLDLVRRRALGLRAGERTLLFRPGHERADLPDAGGKGNTTRFSLRRARPKTAPEAFEPMLDFDQKKQPAASAAPAPENPAPAPEEPALTGTFEMPAARRPVKDKEEPLGIRTAGPQAAARSRRQRQSQPTRPEPQPSVLDEEVPDFTSVLDPAVIAAAQAADAADEAAGRSHGADDFRRAADQLFGDRDAPAAPPRSHSLEVVERSERRRRRTVVLILALLVLLLLAGAGGVWWFFRNDLGARPSPKNYGTQLFDETAASYLSAAAEKQPGVIGYLAFPGQEGQFVYPEGSVATGEDAAPLTVFAGPNYLPGGAPSNTVLRCGDLADFATLDYLQQNSGFTLYLSEGTYRFKVLGVYYAEADGEQPAFGGAADLSAYYDYLAFVTGVRARSLYDTGVEVGDGARFLTLAADGGEDGVLLCVTGRLIGEDESAQLMPSAITAAAEPLLTEAQYRREGREAPALVTLLTEQLGWFAEQTAEQPEATPEPTAAPDGTADGSLSEEVEAMGERTQELLAAADKLLAGLTDVAGSANAAEASLNQGAEGALPEQTVTVDQLIAATPTPAPTEAPTASPEENNGETPAESPTEAPTEAPTAPPAEETPAAETIRVTMNGTAQEMDLVQCLAMVAQNELGPNAPAEAYKAQCVATHCWIVSQSGYPSVAGTTPGAAALAAAQEVAHVLVTYNGQVCFTPYFASASTGTASARDVWGNDRAWLQAVDSPYDQQVASNWNTNGATSGTARFARQTVQDRIQEKLGLDLSGVDPSQWFTIRSANAYGWVTSIQIGPDSGNTYTGTWFRESLMAGQSVDGRSLRSQCFTVTYDAGLDCFIFDVYGYGHGCGLSQWGAIGYARNGWNYQDILTHYYPGTTIMTY